MRLIKQVKNHLKESMGLVPSPVQFHRGSPFIFVHINKTGGTSIGSAIGTTVKSHQTARQIIKRIGRDDWKSAFKFTFVRNPWDRIVSLYKYRRQKNKTRLASHQLTFDEWIEKTIGNQQTTRYYDNPLSFQPQVDWLKDQQDNITINSIGRFERFEEDFNRISKEIGLQVQLPHLNASTSTPYQTFYSKQSRETVAHWYAEDILTFDYRFEA